MMRKLKIDKNARKRSLRLTGDSFVKESCHKPSESLLKDFNGLESFNYFDNPFMRDESES